MTGGHPVEDELVGLALDELDRSRRDEVLGHLGECESCLADYDALAGALDRVLPAAPRIAPPAGFDGAVVAALGVDGDRAGGPPRPGAPRGRWVRLAAAVLIGVVLGAGVTAAVISSSDRSGYADYGTVLRTPDGRAVGSVAVSALEGRPVVVIGVSRAPAGAEYGCRLLLSNGRRVEAGSWRIGGAYGGTWVVRARVRELAGVELVTPEGTLWSSARLRAR